MIQMLHQLREMAEESKFRHYEMDSRVHHLEYRVEPIFDFAKLMFEATEQYHEMCLDLIHEDGISKYTIAEIESCRFMTPYQFNLLRDSKK